MGILRAELQGCGMRRLRQVEGGRLITVTCGIYDGIAESAADLTAEQHTEYTPGSMMYCLENGRLYVRKPDMSWVPVAAAAAETAATGEEAT